MFRAAIVLMLLSAVPAFAQRPGGPPPRQAPVDRAAQERSPQDRHKWWIGPPAQELGLTSNQSQRIEDIYQSVFPKIQASMQDVDTNQKELDKIIAGDKTTEMDVIRQLNIVQVARNEVNRQVVLMLYRMNRELTTEQRAKAKALRDRREQERREGRRGEPPPQRPPTKK